MTTKKLYSIIFLVILILAVIFFFQAKRASEIKVQRKNAYLISPQSIEIPIDNTDKVFGNPGAGLTIVEYNTFGCSKCQKVHQAAINFVNQHPKDARLIWKDYPKKGWFSTDYSLAHKAAYCAGKQNRFWEFLQLILDEKTRLGQIGLNKTATELGLNMADWENCINDQNTIARLTNTVTFAKNLGIKETPAIFLNNKEVNLENDISLEEMFSKVMP